MCAKTVINHNNFYIIVEKRRNDLVVAVYDKDNDMKFIKKTEIKSVFNESLKNKDFQNRIIKMLEL